MKKCRCINHKGAKMYICTLCNRQPRDMAACCMAYATYGTASPEAMRFIKHTSRNARCRKASTLSSGLCVASASYLLARSLWWTASRRAFMASEASTSYSLARSLWWTASRRAFMALNWKVAPSDLRSMVLLNIGFDIGFPSARKFNCACEILKVSRNGWLVRWRLC